ncbi:MAG: cytochrome c [Spirochaetota bacterium]|nr:cytochrome c [Spirochaetota bacterium]
MRSKIALFIGVVTVLSMTIFTCGGKKTVDKPSAPPKENTEKATAKPAPKADAPAASAKDGEKLVMAKCIACHTIDGKKAMSSSLKGLFGQERTVVTKGKERKVKADEAYLLKSIMDPTADTLKNGGIMPDMAMKEAEAKAIVEYIKTLK